MTKDKKRRKKQPEPDFFKLDKNALDEEWINQPGLYFTYAKKLADAKESLEINKANYELAMAE